MTDEESAEESQQDDRKDMTQRLRAYLVEERDEWREMRYAADTQHETGYSHGRYHAYCDILAWLGAEVDDD